MTVQVLSGKAGWLSDSSQNIWLGPRVRGRDPQLTVTLLCCSHAQGLVPGMSITSTVVQRADIRFHEAPEALRSLRRLLLGGHGRPGRDDPYRAGHAPTSDFHSAAELVSHPDGFSARSAGST